MFGFFTVQLTAGDKFVFLDFTDMHEGGITSVQFNPSNGTQLLTNGMDSCLKIVDIRTFTPLHVLKDDSFQTSYAWASGCFSPDGKLHESRVSSIGVKGYIQKFF